MAIKHRDIWTALAAPFLEKFGVVRPGDTSAGQFDISWPAGWSQQGDTAAGVAQNLIGTNAGGLVTLGAANGTVVNGPLLENLGGASVQTSSSTTGISLSNAQMLNVFFLRTGANSAQTDTTRTAAQLVAAIPGVQVGQCFFLTYKNASSNDVTLGLGTGVTKGNSGDTVVISTVKTAQFMFQFTNVTLSSEAVKVWTLGQSAS